MDAAGISPGHSPAMSRQVLAPGLSLLKSQSGARWQAGWHQSPVPGLGHGAPAGEWIHSSGPAAAAQWVAPAGHEHRGAALGYPGMNKKSLQEERMYMCMCSCLNMPLKGVVKEKGFGC